MTTPTLSLSDLMYRTDMRMVFGNSSIQNDLYNTTDNAALGESLGLRHEYRWGLYHYCAYILEPTVSGVCSNTTFALAWTPFEAMRDDIPPKYFVQVNEFIINSLRDSPYLGTLSRVAYWLILVATIATICVIPLYAPFGVIYISQYTHISLQERMQNYFDILARSDSVMRICCLAVNRS